MTAGPPDDAAFMRQALRLARRGEGYVEPNPMVGCVIVQRGRVIGAGYHRRFGGPHAEVEALRSCRRLPRGATVYATLEPCCIYGKTPPCTDALLAAGVARVVAPGPDPNPAISGRGFAQLRKAGVRVDAGVLAEEAAELNRPFEKFMRTGRPWVILKWAQSLDGKIATRSGDAKWISGEASRVHAHRVRGRIDAIVVGSGTVLRDDPLLTCRVGRPRRIATRIVLDGRLRTPVDAQVVRTAREVPTWIFTARDPPAVRARRLGRAGCIIRRLRRTRGGLALDDLLDVLGVAQMTNVLVEGGSAVLGSFFEARLADELHVYIAPRLIGGNAAPGPLGGLGPARVADALALPANVRWQKLGADSFVRARL